MTIIPALPDCGQPATFRLEVFRPRDGVTNVPLDRVIHACAEHVESFAAAVAETGASQHRTGVPDAHQGATPTHCGEVDEYATAIRHPRWCRDREQCLSLGVHTGQVRPINPDPDSGDETALICAWLAQGVAPAESLHAIVLQITDEGVTRHHWLPVAQARVLAHVVRELLDQAKQ